MIRNALYRTLWTGAVLAANVFALPFLHGQALSPVTRLVTTAVDNGDRVSLSGSVRRNVLQARDLGVADRSLVARHVIMVLNRSAERQAALDQYLSDVQNARSAQYHHWLTPAEYGQRFGASADDVQALTAWLQSQGLTIERSSVAANMISFTGTVGQIEVAFSTTIHSVSINNEKHLANINEPKVPRSLAPAVKGLLGLDDFHPHANVHRGPTGTFDPVTHRIQPDLTLFNSAGDPILYVDPADAATIYDVPNSLLNKAYKGTNYDGTGVTVGIVGDSNVELNPVANYRLAFLGETASSVNLPNVIIDGTDPGITPDEIETFLDLEVLGGIAPKAKINYYTSNDSDISGGLFNAMERAVNDNQVSILSISFGECEANLGTASNQFFNELYAQASAQGITVAVSSGDSGSANCDSSASPSATAGLAVNGLGSTPYNISVGGTDYDALLNGFSTYVDATTSGNPPYYATALGYIPERPWNDSTQSNGALADNSPLMLGSSTNVIAAGGGQSSVYAKPAFQSALTPADGVRDLPDVSFLAGNGVYGAVWVICEADPTMGDDCATTNGAFTASTRFSGAGGTSAATPAFAGMLALVVQATGSRLGQANNVLYQLAANKYGTIFHDVTAGNNAVVCSTNGLNCGGNGFITGYDAVTGYDLASGLGSVDASAMLANWSTAVGGTSSASLTINGSAAPVSVTHGTSLNFGVTVNPSTASGVAGLVTTAVAAPGAPTLNGTPYTMTINNGSGSGAYNGLPGGQYTVYATYGGDLNDAASQSNAINVNIAAEASSTKLWLNAYTNQEATISNTNAIPYGSYIFGETSVYGTAEGFANSLGYANGSMTYLDNGAPIGTAPINSGNFASFPQLTGNSYSYVPGLHKLTATFPGDPSYKPNTSNEVDFTVVKASTGTSLIPSVASVTSTTTDNVEVLIASKSLANVPTGTVTVTANGKTLATTSNLLNGYSSLDGTALAYVVIPVNGAQLLNGANTITATYSGDSNYLGSVGTKIITASISAFSLKTAAIGMTAGSTTGNIATLSVIPSGSFAGLVNLSCAVTTAPANATSPVTCSVPASIVVSGTGIANGTLTVNSTAITTGGSYVVTITGTDAATGKITATTTSAVTVTGTPGILLSNGAPITVTAGATTGNTSTLSITPISGFAGAVSLSCAVTTMPANAVNPVTCGLSSASVTLNGTTASTSVLTISSTARTTSGLNAIPGLMRTAGGTVLAFGLLLWVPARRRRQFRLLAMLSAIVALGSLVGCGGAKATTGGGTTTNPGTTAGSYVVTITASPTGVAAQTTTVNVTVN